MAGSGAKIDRFGKDAKAAGERGTKALESGAIGAAGAVRAMLAAAAGYGASQLASKALADAAALGKLSAAAGLTTQEFQRLVNGARLSGVTDDISGALASFSEKATLARSKMGELYETLKFAAPVLADQLKDTRTTTQALELYAEAVRRVEGADAKATLAKKAFGEAGVSLLPVLQKGAAGIVEMQKDADEFATVVSDKAIASAKGLSKELSLLGAEAEAQLANRLAGAADAAAGALGRVREMMREVGKGNLNAAGLALTGGIKEAEDVADVLAGVNMQIAKLEQHGAEAQNWLTRAFGKDVQAQIAGLKAEAADLEVTLTRLMKDRTALRPSLNESGGGDAFTLKEKPDFTGIDAVMASVQALAAAKGELIRSAQIEAAQQIEAARRLLEERRMTETQFGEIRKNVTAATEARVVELRKASSAELRALEIEAQTVRNEGFAAIGLQYEAELEKYQDQLRQKIISEEQFQRARENLNAVAGERIKTEMDRVGGEARKSTEGIASAIETSLNSSLTGTFTSASEAAQQLGVSLLKSLSEAIVKALVLAPLMEAIRGTGQSTGIAGAIGSAFGIGGGNAFAAGGNATTAGWGAAVSYNAEGGMLRAGTPSWINERPGRKGEVFVPDVAGRMVPGERAGGAGVSGSAGNVVNHFTIDARGADAGVSDRIINAVAAANAQKANAVEANAAFARRFPTRR